MRSGAWKNHTAERENKDGSGSFVRFIEAEFGCDVIEPEL
jgi:hypothetical protein